MATGRSRRPGSPAERGAPLRVGRARPARRLSRAVAWATWAGAWRLATLVPLGARGGVAGQPPAALPPDPRERVGVAHLRAAAPRRALTPTHRTETRHSCDTAVAPTHLPLEARDATRGHSQGQPCTSRRRRRRGRTTARLPGTYRSPSPPLRTGCGPLASPRARHAAWMRRARTRRRATRTRGCRWSRRRTPVPGRILRSKPRWWPD
jgi:hypothetical protein